MTGYTVLRARKEFGNQSSLGFMTTSTNRQNDAATSFLPDNAYAGGIDYDWRLSPMYSITGYAAPRRISRAAPSPSPASRRTTSTGSSGRTRTTWTWTSTRTTLQRARRLDLVRQDRR